MRASFFSLPDRSPSTLLPHLMKHSAAEGFIFRFTPMALSFAIARSTVLSRFFFPLFIDTFPFHTLCHYTQPCNICLQLHPFWDMHWALLHCSLAVALARVRSFTLALPPPYRYFQLSSSHLVFFTKPPRFSPVPLQYEWHAVAIATHSTLIQFASSTSNRHFPEVASSIQFMVTSGQGRNTCTDVRLC